MNKKIVKRRQLYNSVILGENQKEFWVNPNRKYYKDKKNRWRLKDLLLQYSKELTNTSGNNANFLMKKKPLTITHSGK